MKISNEWLSDFIKTDLPIEKIADILTDIGLEVEGTEQSGVSKEDLEGFVVGEVISCEPHPNADKLKVTQVNLGEGEPVQIVCGAPNVGQGQKVPVATIGTVLKDGKGNSFTIKKAKLRGESSHGMICSQKELRISEENDGIWVMDEALTPGTPVSEVVELSQDTTYEIGLTPNRADAMSHYGVARDLHSALASRKLNSEWKEVEVEEIKAEGESPIHVDVQDHELCPRYAGVYIKGVEVKESPKWLQQRLQAIGLSPINNIVDATNYVLHGLGQPMHAFDAEKIAGQKIEVKKANADEKFTTLDKVERTLSGEELMICDAEKSLGIAGVMGGLDSSVTESTKNIFLESAYFNPVSVRKTAKHHAINSDSSFRFERGVDPNTTVKVLQYAVQLIQEIAGGEVVGNVTDIYPNPIEDFKVILKYRTIDRLLGERIHRQKIKEILESLDIKVITDTSEVIELQVPAYRVDVQREVDVIEEILRIYGYNNILVKEKLTTSIVSGEGFLEQKITEGIASNLTSKGFYEAMNLSMYKKNFNDVLGFEEEKSVELLNSLSKDLSVMRRSLLPGLLQNVDYNRKRKNTNVKLFEFGKTYAKEGDAYQEKQVLGIVLSGQQRNESWLEKSRTVTIYDLKGVVEQLLTQFKADDYETDELKESYYQNALVYKIGGKPIAHIAEIQPKTLSSFDIDEKVYYAEFDMAYLINHYKENREMKFKPLPKFPLVRRDLALLMDKDKTYEEVKKEVLKTDPKHIIQVNLFDVYEGDKLPSGKKSYAISLHLRDEEKTMQDKQIESIMKKVVNNLMKKLGVELRNG